MVADAHRDLAQHFASPGFSHGVSWNRYADMRKNAAWNIALTR